MAIAQYLKDERFDPEAILEMSMAFEKVCNKLLHRDRFIFRHLVCSPLVQAS